MRWVKRLAAMLIAVTVLIWGIFFGIENQARVSLSLVFIEFPEASLSAWMVAAFVLGGLFSLLLTSSLLLKQKSKYLLLKRQLAKGNKRLMESPSGLTGK